jgi:hypothetical protein
MKRYSLTLADSLRHKPDKPELTARRGTGGFDMQYQVWTNRESLARTVRMQQKGGRHHASWSPIIPLSDGEGY